VTLRIWLLQIEEIIEISSLVNALSRRVYEPETVSRKLIEILKFIFRNFKLIYYRVWRVLGMGKATVNEIHCPAFPI
jgi:hypothetical protein